jgi:hypothetical protein
MVSRYIDYAISVLLLCEAFNTGAAIAQSIQRWATGCTAGVRFPTWARHFSLLHSVQTGSGAHPASYPMGTGDFSSCVKAAVA